MSATGKEVDDHKDELRAVLIKIMRAHTKRKGCAWKPGAVRAILRDLPNVLERQELCQGVNNG